MADNVRLLFDLDGTTAETESHGARAHTETILRFGNPEHQDLYLDLLGQSREDVITTIINVADCNCTFAEYEKAYVDAKARLRAELGIQPQPGIISLLHQLELFVGVDIAIVTASSRDHMETVLEATKTSQYYAAQVCADDLPSNQQKPHPGPYLLALERLPPSSRLPVAIEDTPPGIRSAKAAGCYTFGYRHDFNAKLDLSEADGIIESYEESTVIGRLVAAAFR